MAKKDNTKLQQVSKDLTTKVEAAVKAAGKFEEVDIDARLEEAFVASGGLFIKRWMSADKKFPGDITFSVNGRGQATVRCAFPITLPMKREEIGDTGIELMALAESVVPGNLHLSAMGRVTLAYEDTKPAAAGDGVLNMLNWRLGEGARVSQSLRNEIGRHLGSEFVFDSTKDEIWQSEMGKPVKLSAEALALVQGGGYGKDLFKWGAGVIIGGGIIVLATPLTWIGQGIIGGGGVYGSTSGAEEVWDAPPTSCSSCAQCGCAC